MNYRSTGSYRRYGPKGTQFVRQWKVLLMLRRGQHTLRQMATAMRCNERTIRRDIAVLQEAGLPVEVVDTVGDGGWTDVGIWRVGRIAGWPRNQVTPVDELPDTQGVQ